MAGALAMNYQPEQVVDISKLTREEWLEYRRQGIGGSDVAVIMGFPRLRQAGTFTTTRLA